MKKRLRHLIMIGGLSLGLFFSLQPAATQTLAEERTGEVLPAAAPGRLVLNTGMNRTGKRTARQAGEVTIASFDPLEPNVAEQTVAVGTALSKLNLPESLSGTDLEKNPLPDIPVTWKTKDAAYDPSKPQDYIFIAEPGSGYVLAPAAALPEIVVTVTGFEPTTLPENYVRVTVKAGELKTKVEKGQVLPQKIAALFIEGTLNEQDMKYIRGTLTNLKTLDLEKTALITIPNAAFSSMTSLENLVLPASVKTIGEQALKDCTHLTAVNLAGVNVVGDSAFEGCASLGAVNLSQVQTLGEKAFTGCSNLTLAADTNLSQALKTIGESAFENCGKLTGVDLSQVEAIGAAAFKNCEKLTLKAGTNLNEKVTIIHPFTFTSCTYLTAVDLSHVVMIGDSAFKNCGRLGEVDLSQVTLLQDSAFEDCHQLKLKASTNLNPGLSVIGNRAFSQCAALTQIDLSHVETIGEEAFAHCASISEANLIKTTTLGAGAFKNCTGLSVLGMPANKPNWQTTPFENVPAVLLLFENSQTYADLSVFPSGSSVPVIEGKDIQAGETLELTIKPQINGNVTYQWSFNGTPLSAQTNPTLKIDQAQASHSGVYQCDLTWGPFVQRAEKTVKVTEIIPTPTPTPTPTPKPQPVHEHNYGPMQSDPTWHYRECLDGDGAKAEIAEHTPGDWIIIEKATATKPGSKKKVCTVCGRQLEWQEIPATGPEYAQKTLKSKENGIQIHGEFSFNSALAASAELPHKEGSCDACDAIREQQKKDGWLSGYRLQLKAGKYRGSLTIEIPVDQKDGTELNVWICQNKTWVKDTKKVTSKTITLTMDSWPDYIGFSEVPVVISGLPGSLNLTVGEQTTLKPQPEGGSWEYDPSVLEITGQDSYTVKALKTGETTITYSAGGERFSLKVQVAEKAAEPEPEVKKTGSIVPFAIGILVFAAVVLIGGAVFLKRQIDQSQG